MCLQCLQWVQSIGIFKGMLIRSSHIFSTHHIMYPEPGCKFSKHLKFGIIGHQFICLEILSKENAHIFLEGIVNIDSNLKYSMMEGGKINFEMTKDVQKVLDWFYCDISDATYIDGTATIRIRIKPLLFNKKIILKKDSSAICHSDYCSN